MRSMCDVVRGVAVSLVLFIYPLTALAQTEQSAAFTYQGLLKDGDAPAAGTYSLRFRLYDAATGGSQVASPQFANDIVIDEDGLFSVDLDFGADAFDGSMRWLDVSVGQPPMGFEVLSPRHPVTTAPVSSFSLAPWMTNDDGVHYSGGRVGIGTDMPEMDLEARRAIGPGSVPSIGVSGMSAQGERWTRLANAGSGLLAWNDGVGLRMGTETSIGSGFTEMLLIADDGSLRVAGGNELSLGSGGDFIIGSTSATNLAMDTNEIMCRFNGAPTSLFINQNGGNVVISGAGTGRLGVGITAPKQTIHVDGDYYGRGHLWLHAYEGDGQSGTAYIQARDDSGSSIIGMVLRTQLGSTLYDAMTLNGRRVNIGPPESTVTPATLYIDHTDGLFTSPALRMNRTDGDGSLISFHTLDTPRGSITVVGSTVSYNAFTGSHYAWSDAPTGLRRGMLMTMTGHNDRLSSEADSEVVYGVAPATRANDAACLGVYLGAHDEASASGRGILLVSAEGNTDMWIVDHNGNDVEPGDLLIASSVPGCAMKDDPSQFATGNIVARAAEHVRWADVKMDTDGLRRVRISVLLTCFQRAPDVSALQRANESLRERLDQLEGRLR